MCRARSTMAPIHHGVNVSRDYIIEHQIGAGGGGKVFAAFSRRTGCKVAVKDIVAVNDQQRCDAFREAEIMHMLNHPNICKLFAVYTWEQHIFLTMEHLSGGDLLDKLDAESSLKEQDALMILRQIAAALAHAHSCGVAHRDLKPENICFTMDTTGRSVAKIVDWGLAETFRAADKQLMTGEVGSPNYAAPEVFELAFGLRESGYTCACDLWSLGVLSYEMMSGQNPFWGDLASMKEEPASFEAAPWQDVSEECKWLIKQLLQADPSKRPTAQELCCHPCINVSVQVLQRPLSNMQALVFAGA